MTQAWGPIVDQWYHHYKQSIVTPCLIAIFIEHRPVSGMIQRQEGHSEATCKFRSSFIFHRMESELTLITQMNSYNFIISSVNMRGWVVGGICQPASAPQLGFTTFIGNTFTELISNTYPLCEITTRQKCIKLLFIMLTVNPCTSK